MKLFARVAFLILILPALVYALSVTVCISNESVQPLEAVTLHYSGGQSTINVVGKGNWTTSIPGNLIGITINNQRINYPSPKTVTLPSGAAVRVSWQSQNLIEVIDLATQG